MNRCILGDCLEFMATLPDNAFDLAITDPPYGIGWTDKIDYKTEATKRNKTRRNYVENKCGWAIMGAERV